MNPAIVNLFNEYHDLTNDSVAAATLVLAQVQSAARPNESELPSGRLLDIKEAAALLGYDPPGLRKLAKQGRIQFLQNGQGPLRFRREWLDAFINANATLTNGKVKKRPRSRQPIVAEPRFGFDPKLYLR
jgi:excisionase family DNA binding protein